MSDKCPKCNSGTANMPGVGPYCPNPDCPVLDDLDGQVSLDNAQAKDAEIARLREAVKVMREVSGDLTDALAVARNRIEYLGELSVNEKHSKANDEVFLPVIDEAMKAADDVLKGGE